MAHVSNEFVDQKFVQSMQSKRCFAAFAKLKADVRKKPIPKIDKDDLIYFQHDFKDYAKHDKVFNVDLKSAYATCLYNAGYISEETSNYLAKISKNDRLASVGMLASKKKVFDFGKDGEPFHYEEHVSELENFFYFAVQQTHEIMSKLKAACGHNYLFTWVDGIYFIPDEEILSRCLYILAEHKFNWSFDELTNFEVKPLGSYIKVTFDKDDKFKRFAIPTQQSQFRKLASDVLISLNNKKQKSK